MYARADDGPWNKSFRVKPYTTLTWRKRRYYNVFPRVPVRVIRATTASARLVFLAKLVSGVKKVLKKYLYIRMYYIIRA